MKRKEKNIFFFILIWLILMCRYLNLGNLVYIKKEKERERANNSNKKKTKVISRFNHFNSRLT